MSSIKKTKSLPDVVRFPTKLRDFSVPQNAQTDSGNHPAFYSVGKGYFSCRAKAADV